MTDEIVAVSVLNGEVQVGDRVAYAGHDGGRAGIRLGTVIEVYEREDSWSGRRRPAIKVEVDRSSGYHRKLPVKTAVAKLDRVVKL